MEIETVWAAGLFEGEGSIIHPSERKVRLALKMTTEASVRRFCAAVGVGKVYGPYGPYKAQPNRTPFFMWIAEGMNAVIVSRLIGDIVSEPWKTRLAYIATNPHAFNHVETIIPGPHVQG